MEINRYLKQSGFALIGPLLILVFLIIAAGGVVMWKEKVSPTPTPTPTLQILLIPTVSPTWTQSCASDNDCPKQFCQPPDKPCAQYYCIQGKCQLVEPRTTNQCSDLNEKECVDNSKCIAVYGPSCPVCMDIVFKKCRERKPGEIKKAPWGIIGSLNEKIKLTLGQTTSIQNTNLSLTLLKIDIPSPNQPNCCPDVRFDCPILSHECPVIIEIEARSGTKKELATFRLPGFGTMESREATWRNKEVFGFRIRIEEESPKLVVLTVKKL